MYPHFDFIEWISKLRNIGKRIFFSTNWNRAHMYLFSTDLTNSPQNLENIYWNRDLAATYWFFRSSSMILVLFLRGKARDEYGECQFGLRFAEASRNYCLDFKCWWEWIWVEKEGNQVDLELGHWFVRWDQIWYGSRWVLVRVLLMFLRCCGGYWRLFFFWYMFEEENGNRKLGWVG